MIHSTKAIASLTLFLSLSVACSTTEKSPPELPPAQEPTSSGVREGTQHSGAGNTTGVSGSTPDNNASMGGGTDSPANENVGSQSVTIMDGGKSSQASPTPTPTAKKKTR